jgi:hypothetical protein
VPSYGAYLGTNGGKHGGGTDFAAFEELTGKFHPLQRIYLRAWDSPLPNALIDKAFDTQHIPVISIKPNLRDGTRLRFTDITAGRQDDRLIAISHYLRDKRRPAFFVFLHEPEDQIRDNLYGDATEYRAAVRHLVQVLRAQGASNVSHMMILTDYTYDGHNGGPEQFFAGADVLDWVGSDLYNWLDCANQHRVWRSFAEWAATSLAFARRVNLPLMIGEYSSNEDPTNPNHKAEWFRSIPAELARMPEVKALVHFQVEPGICNFWVDSSSQSLAGYREMVRSPYFAPRFEPAVHIESPAANSSVGGITPVTVSASDADGVKSVTLSVDGKPLGTDTAAPYSFSWDTQTLPPGQHELTATAIDNTGLRASDQIRVTVRDTTLPTVKFVSPADGAYITGTTFNVDAKVSDNVGVESVNLRVNGTFYRTLPSGPYHLTVPASKLHPGENKLELRARDASTDAYSSSTITVWR